MNLSLRYILRKVLELERKASLFHFCNDFQININSYLDSNTHFFTLNFVYFLIENKSLMLMYELDYYKDKSIKIIAKKIGRNEEEIDNYFRSISYVVDKKYPYRYFSSYKINYDLGGKCNFLKYDENRFYQGTVEYRREHNEN